MVLHIKVYETKSGQTPVETFIKGMQPPAQAKLARLLTMLEEFGAELSMPHSKPLGDSLYELRIRGKQEVRVFYIFAVARHIYLLHAFQKKTQTTPKKELTIARQRQIEIESIP
ncbi:MAG: type II toxin-antitoxin system RelE/ParE family toxin [Candidatus Saccharimonadales bacterium]